MNISTGQNPTTRAGGQEGPNRFAEAKPREAAEPKAELRRSFAEALLPTKLERVEETAGAKASAVGSKIADFAARLKDLAESANTYLIRTETQLQFEVSESTGRVIVRVIDKESGETIREIPPEELHRFAERANELRGLLFDAEG